MKFTTAGNPVFITGMGVIAPVGDNVTECYQALLEKRTGIGIIRYLDTVHRGSFPVGEVKYSHEALLELAGIPRKDHSRYTRASLLALMAVREAIESAGLSGPELKSAACVSANSVGGMDITEKHYGKKGDPSLDFLYTHPAGDTADKICDFFHLETYRTTLSTACSSGANALLHAALLIQQGLAQRVIAGGVDPLCKFTLNGFNSLMILDKEPCRPFDQSRNGLNLGEGAGYLVLESEASVRQRQARVLCRLSGFSNTNDAFHQTASSPDGEGAYQAMHQALETAGLQPEQIGYINVHGTGTQNNDLSEGIAIGRVFGHRVPPFSSTKSLTGHALGAAAAIEAVFSVQALIHNTLLPQINFTIPIEETGLVPCTEPGKAPLAHVLSNAFGFGGNNSSLIFSK